MNLQEQISRIQSMMGVIKEDFNNHLIGGRYLYHYTLTDNLNSILEEGIIPRKNPNSFYKEGIEGVFLTNKSSLYNVNLPQTLMDVMDDYYNNEDMYDEKPIVRLTIDVSSLDIKLFDVDDDYKLNLYKWNKSENHEDKLTESLDLWGSVSYKGQIPVHLIKNIDFNYGA